MNKKALEISEAVILIAAAAAAAFFYVSHKQKSEVRYLSPLPLPSHVSVAPAAKPAATTTPPFKRHPDVSLPYAHPAISLGTARVTASSPNVFAYAHATVEADGKFFIGMSNKAGNIYPPNQLTVFNDEADLSRPSILELPESGDIQAMVFDAKNDKVYLQLSSNGSLEIFSIDPHTFAIATVISTTTIDAGRKPAIATDGTYVYGITNTQPSLVYKVRLADGELTVNRKGHIPDGHSAAVGVYEGRTELYFGGGMSNGFEKVDAETLGRISSIDVAPCSMSDDSPFVRIDDIGGYVFVGCETVPYGVRIRTSDMSMTRFSLPGGSFGLFAIGDDIYNAAQDGYIDVFPGGRLEDLRRYKVVNESAPFDTKGQDLEVNEVLFSPLTRKIYMTAWLGIPGLHQVATSTP